jgi:hypothetical protein
MKREIIMFLDRISNTFKLKLLIICLISCVVSFLNPLKFYQSCICNGYYHVTYVLHLTLAVSYWIYSF